MNYRTVKVHSRENYTGDTVEVIDLNLADPISELLIILEGVNAADAMDGHPDSIITDVEVIDGSDVLLSLDGQELVALDFYASGGKVRHHYNNHIDTNVWKRAIGYRFGRWLWDPILALDPTRFKNLQLRISTDMSAGGNSLASYYMEVWAAVFDEKVPSLQGFLTAREHKQWTMADDTHEYTDLPTDHPYRFLFHKAQLAGTSVDGSVENIKISEDQDKRVPFDIPGRELVQLLAAPFGPYTEAGIYYAGTDATTLYITPAEAVLATEAEHKATAGTVPVSVLEGAGGTIAVITGTAARDFQMFTRGFCPHATLPLAFGDPNMIDDWFQANRVGNLRADIEGAAAAQGFLFSQQLRGY